jgi:hypothetical protein
MGQQDTFLTFIECTRACAISFVQHKALGSFTLSSTRLIMLSLHGADGMFKL